MDAELAELEQDDGDHNIESERDTLNRLAARAKIGGSTLRPTENYDSEPESSNPNSPMVSTGDRA